MLTRDAVTVSQSLGVYLDTMRQLNGLRPIDVATRAGVYPNMISKLLSGDTERPFLGTVQRLTKAVGGLGVDVWWIQEHDVDEETARTLAEARYATQQRRVLTPEQRAVMERLLSDPEVAAIVAATIEARQKTQ